jgi:CheY-like chemotaxis protein
MFLQKNGYRVLSAADGAEALLLAQRAQGPIHLLLTDVVMPGMNGRVLADRLAPWHASMKVLYMSGYTDSFIAGHGVSRSRHSLAPQTVHRGNSCPQSA